MRKLFKTVMLVGAITACIGLTGCKSKEEKAEEQKMEKCLSAIQKGLENRWKVTNDDTNDINKLHDQKKKGVAEELKTAKSYENTKFKDKKFQKLVRSYVEALKSQDQGVNYEFTDSKQYEELFNKKGYDVPYFSLGNLFITYVTENEPETKWDEFQDFNDAAKSSPALGFKFNSKSVSTEIAAVNNVLEEFKATIYSGSVDVDEYLEKLNTKLKQQGLDKIIEEMQRQIDEWKASK